MTIQHVTDPATNPLPSGVRAIAALFAVCAIYLASLAILMLTRPGLISMAAGAPLLFGLELAGPYMFLLVAIAAGGITWGLTRLNNIMRHAAIPCRVRGHCDAGATGFGGCRCGAIESAGS